MEHQNTRTGVTSTPVNVLVAFLVGLCLLLAACADSDVSTDAATVAAAESDPGDQATDSDSESVDTEPVEEVADPEAESDDEGDSSETAAATETVSVLPSDYLGSYNLADSGFGTMVTVTVEGGTRTIDTNALPDHDTGDFPNGGNPNTISAQDLTWELPAESTFTGNGRQVRTSGIAVNGVKFEPGTAETTTCDDGTTYRIEALQGIYDLGLDFNNAHVQPTGEYHYHGISELLVGIYESDDDLVHIGFALDGHLIYYSKSGAYESGYQLSDTPRTGDDCEASFPGGETVDLDGTAADGTYTSDWVFDTDNGDLDACNGVTIDGQYVYLVTDSFPYISRCLNGEFTEAGPGGDEGGPGGERPAGADDEGAAPGQDQASGQGPDMSEAAAALGVTEQELLDALGGPPPDLASAAETLGVSAEELQAILPAPPGR